MCQTTWKLPATPYFNMKHFYGMHHNADHSKVDQRDRKVKGFKKKNVIQFIISPDITSENEGLGFCWA